MVPREQLAPKGGKTPKDGWFRETRPPLETVNELFMGRMKLIPTRSKMTGFRKETGGPRHQSETAVASDGVCRDINRLLFLDYNN